MLTPPNPPLPNHNPLDLPPAGERAVAQFIARFGRKPDVLSFSPGRVNLIGEHTDYNDGFVMPFAIEQGVYVAAGKSPTYTAECWTDFAPDQPANFTLQDPVSNHGPAWSSYVRGVAQGLLKAGIKLPGFQAVITGDLPTGGGLSSSAALEVSSAKAMLALAGQHLDERQLALLCQAAEHQYAGTPCGIMDQFAVVFGKIDCVVQLDCRSHQFSTVPFAEGAPSLLVMNTMVRHSLNDGGYKARRISCESAAAQLGLTALRDATLADVESLAEDTLKRRARHVVTENARCLEAAVHMQQGNWAELGSLLYASHASLRDDFTVSCPELDLLVQSAQEIGLAGGVYGCRMTGGGFGGCCIALVEPARLEEIAASLAATYQKATSITPIVFHAKPASGARVRELES